APIRIPHNRAAAIHNSMDGERVKSSSLFAQMESRNWRSMAPAPIRLHHVAASVGRETPIKTFENSGFRSQFLNLGRELRQAALKTPDRTALVCGEEQLSFQGLDQSTDTLARWLLRAGLQPGDRVAIHWSNSLEVVQLYFACFKAGLIAVPLNVRLKAPEI